MKIILLAALLFSTPALVKDKLTGRWESQPSASGNVTGALFKEDNTFEAYTNRKPFTWGRYTLTDSSFSFTDTGCDELQGNYKIIFFSNNDSIRFETIQDDCTDRRRSMERTILGRVKE